MSASAPGQGLLAVVTGGGRGIGRAIAERLADEGYRLELTGLEAEDLERTRADLATKTSVHAEACDFRDRHALDAWLEGLLAREPQIDVLVQNAGVGGPDADDDAETLAHLDHVLEVNAGAVHRIARGLAKHLRDDGRGRVVIVASVLGKMGVPGFSAYCASKAAAIGLTRAMALDLARHGVTVNAVCPGWTDTAMAQQGFEALASDHGGDVGAARAAVEKGLPLGRIVRPEEVAGMVAFLAGPDAGAMSGQALTMSAGDLQR
jgi:3-hydroxybutyrate dehydrogenase